MMREDKQIVVERQQDAEDRERWRRVIRCVDCLKKAEGGR